MAEDRQRIDKWLWFARMAKTRPVAQTLAESGHVRINGRKIDASSQPVRIGDVLTIGLRGEVRVLKVLGLADRRGAYPQARLLYEDLAPRPDPSAGGTEEPADGRGVDAPTSDTLTTETPDGGVIAADPARGDGPGQGASPPPDAPPRARPASPGGEKPRPVRGEGRPTKRDRRRFDRVDPHGSS